MDINNTGTAANRGRSQHYQRFEYSHIEEQLIYDWARREFLDLGAADSVKFMQDILNDAFSLDGLPMVGKNAKAIIRQAYQDYLDYNAVIPIVENKVEIQAVPSGYQGLDFYVGEMKDVVSETRRIIEVPKGGNNGKIILP
jgi:hypothetical protein